jgi:HrpA-like RNA helicase
MKIKRPRTKTGPENHNAVEASRLYREVRTVGIIKSYSQAIQSSNLRDDEHHHQTEKLAAVAMSGTLGNLLFRVKYANDHTSYNALKEAWTELVTAKAKSRRWPDDVSPKKVARLALDYWQNDLCETCGGSGHKAHPDNPQLLLDDACSACKGTAKKPIQVKHNLMDYVSDMVETIETMTARAANEAMKKLAGEMELP